MTDDGFERRLAALDRRIDGCEHARQGPVDGADRRRSETSSTQKSSTQTSSTDPPSDPMGEGRRSAAAPADRLHDLEARVQALEGYVGEVRAVNDRVRARADTALARTAHLTDSGAVEPDTQVPAPPPEKARGTAGADRSHDGKPETGPESPERSNTRPEAPDRTDARPGGEPTDWPSAEEVRSRGVLARLLERW